MNFRFRGGSPAADNSTTNYNWHIGNSVSSSTSYSAQAGAASTFLRLAAGNGTNALKAIDLTLFNPFASFSTLGTWDNVHTGNSGAAPANGGASVGIFGANTSFTGFKLIGVNGTLSGTIRVFGWAN